MRKRQRFGFYLRHGNWPKTITACETVFSFLTWRLKKEKVFDFSSLSSCLASIKWWSNRSGVEWIPFYFFFVFLLSFFIHTTTTLSGALDFFLLFNIYSSRVCFCLSFWSFHCFSVVNPKLAQPLTSFPLLGKFLFIC